MRARSRTSSTRLQTEDFDTVDALLADDLVWQNVGLPTIRGGARVRKMLRGAEGRMGFEVKFHRNVAEGGTVLNERTDAMIFGPLRLQFWVCGVFEVTRRADHPVARLLRLLRLRQGDPARDRRDGGACAAPEDVTGTP